jgi:hypothetical protein
MQKYLFIFLLSSLLGYAQTVEQVFKKLNTQYSAPQPLQYKSEYRLYKAENLKKAEEVYGGTYFKNAADDTFVTIGDMEILNTRKLNLKVSNSERAIVISNPVNVIRGELDMKQVLNLCTIRDFKKILSGWQIALIPKKYSNLPYSLIVIDVNKEYFLQKQVFYYNSKMNFSKDYRRSDDHLPRLEITFREYSRTNPSKSVFSTARYFNTVKGQLVFGAKYKNYEVTDQRIVSNPIK